MEMAVLDLLYRIYRFLNFCAVYYAIQLGRCMLLSCVVLAAILVLRRTLFRRTVFLKGVLWCLLLPVLFVGKLRFFYESRAGVRLFWWWNCICMKHVWISWLYLAGIFWSAWRLIGRSRRAEELVSHMECREVEGVPVFLNDLTVTPFTIGLLRPKIVLPRSFLKGYTGKEIRLILLHERLHIHSGHLLILALWDVGRTLLWPNVFLALCTRELLEDLEEMCDKSVIQKSGVCANVYGSLLLKSILLVQDAGAKAASVPAAFAGDREYQRVKARIEKILRYRPYKKAWPRVLALTAAVSIVGAVGLIGRSSYGRCNPMDGISLWDIEKAESIAEDDERLRKAVRYDEHYVYVDTKALQEIVDMNAYADKDVCFVFGGFYKVPGIGGCCDVAYVKGSALTGEEQEDGGKAGVLRIPYEQTMDPWAWIFAVL